MRRLSAAVVIGFLTAGLLAGCSDSNKPAAYPNPHQTVRELESALPGRTMHIGEVEYAAIGLRTNIYSATGSHADVLAKGRYARVRLLMTNHGRERHDLDVFKQQLVTGDGKTYKPSYDAMQVSRGVTVPFTIARDEARAFDLWFDIPAGAKPHALRITGDPTSSRLSDQLKGANATKTATADLPLK